MKVTKEKPEGYDYQYFVSLHSIGEDEEHHNLYLICNSDQPIDDNQKLQNLIKDICEYNKLDFKKTTVLAFNGVNK